MCGGTPISSMFSSAVGSAASLDAVENASTNGSRTARTNAASGMRAIVSHCAQHHEYEKHQRAVQRQHQFAKPQQHADSACPDRVRHGRTHAQRRQIHHIFRVPEHHLGKRLAKPDHRLRLRPDRRAGRAEQKREHHNLQHIAARHGIDHARRNRVLQSCRKTSPMLAAIRSRPPPAPASCPAPGRTRFTAPSPRNSAIGRQRFEIDDGLQPDPAHRLHAARARDAVHQRPENQRRDDRPDQPQKNVGQRGHPIRLRGSSETARPTATPGEHGDEDPGRQRQPFHRSPLSPLQFFPQHVEEKHLRRTNQMDAVRRTPADDMIVAQQRLAHLSIHGEKCLVDPARGKRSRSRLYREPAPADWSACADKRA